MTIQRMQIRPSAITLLVQGVAVVYAVWLRGIYEWGTVCSLHVLAGHIFQQHPFVSAASLDTKEANCSEENCVLFS